MRNFLPTVRVMRSAMTSRGFSSVFGGVPMGPPDAILGLVESFNKDESAQKVSLSVGAYRDDDGKPVVLPAVRAAEKRILDKNYNKEYLGIGGLPSFVEKSLKFAYGKGSTPLKEGRVAAVQTLSGTGACRIAGEFMNKFGLAAENKIYQPNPTWGNHIPIFKDAGMTVEQYPYYDRASNSIDIKGYLETIDKAPNGSAFLVHACAHNPTGLDPTSAQWKQLSDAFKSKSHVVFLDCAYQGFASGDAEKDAEAIRLLVEDGNTVCLAQSFAKNFGLYGERVGVFSVVCKDTEEKERVESQLKIIIRPMYSNPPVNGARIVDEVLGDDKLAHQWTLECKEMADRINTMRLALVDSLKAAGSTKDWSHVTAQIGMFCYSGASPDQVKELREKHHIYLTGDGRISMAGVTSKNVEYIAKALHEVTK